MAYYNYNKETGKITTFDPDKSPDNQQPPTKAKAKSRIQAKQKPKRRYKLVPLLISGIVVSAIMLVVAILIYSAFCYFTNNSGNGSVIAPTIIYMLAIILGSFWVSAVIRQRSLMPAAVIGLIFFILSIVLSLIYFDIATFKLSMIPLKLLFTVLSVIFGFLLATIPNLFGKMQRKRKIV